MTRKYVTDSSRDPLALHPQTRDKLLSLLVSLVSNGLAVRMLDTYRSPESQDALYAQGRTKPGKKVTWATSDKTYHTKRRAFDLALLRRDMALDWDYMDSAQAQAAWEKIAEVAESVGLYWGGRWPDKKKDKPHFEDRFCAKCGADHKAEQFDFDGECNGPVEKEEQP